MAAGDGFFIPHVWQAQNADVDIIKINNIMLIAHSEKTGNGITKVTLVDPNGVVKYERDLFQDGVTHIFGIDCEPSRQTDTWKLGIQTFPRGEFGNSERTMYMLDTGIPVDWAQVAG